MTRRNLGIFKKPDEFLKEPFELFPTVRHTRFPLTPARRPSGKQYTAPANVRDPRSIWHRPGLRSRKAASHFAVTLQLMRDPLSTLAQHSNNIGPSFHPEAAPAVCEPLSRDNERTET
ncbi:hypothetical protein DPEC_G00344980 [Dallia pectoralis]|uniref:Uncharacterized protein n=1 Tax=Dallia pectoralis TaxID=75939 RepID=A0ACC2F3D3_DALPE|nr:hypothetical protein DPEC_G00344980 [Dallia pectoralis]